MLVPPETLPEPHAENTSATPSGVSVTKAPQASQASMEQVLLEVPEPSAPSLRALKDLTPAKPGPAPALNELEDILYDWLDCGASDPNLGQDKLDEIQVFLHQHARTRKSHADFVQFFDQHALSMQVDRPSPLMISRNTGRSLPVDVPLALELPDPAVLRTGSAPTAAATAGHTAAVSRNQSRARAPMTWAWVIGFAAMIGLLSLAVIAIIALRDELATLNVQVNSTTQRLEHLRSETDRLRSVIDDNTRSAQRVEGEVDSLLQAVTAPEDTNSK